MPDCGRPDRASSNGDRGMGRGRSNVTSTTIGCSRRVGNIIAVSLKLRGEQRHRSPVAVTWAKAAPPMLDCGPSREGGKEGGPWADVPSDARRGAQYSP